MDSFIDRIKTLPASAFTEKDIRVLFPAKSNASWQNKIKREVARGEIIRLKRGVYCLTPKHQKRPINLLDISSTLYPPSYISMESALSFYGLIPEAVHSVTAVTTRRNSRFTTSIGIFEYDHLPLSIYNQYFQSTKTTDDYVFLIATPLKCLFDYMYIRKKKYLSLSDLEEDLRIEPTALAEKTKNLSNKEILRYKDVFKNKWIRKIIDLIIWELR